MLSSRLLAVSAALFLAACHSRDRVHVETDEGPPRMAMMISMADPASAPQLLEGFYGLEDKSWRWTAGHFSVNLRVPSGAGQNGAILKVQLSIPQPLIDHVKTTALTASIEGTSLSPESFTQSGAFTLIRDVPAKLMDDESVRVDFSLDRFLPAGTIDPRELGVVVSSVGFEPRKSAPPAP
jgi:hypothetical protein